MDFADRPSVHELMWIKFDGLEPLEASVCWVGGFAAGVRFKKTLHAGVFETLLARLHRSSNIRAPK